MVMMIVIIIIIEKSYHLLITCYMLGIVSYYYYNVVIVTSLLRKWRFLLAGDDKARISPRSASLPSCQLCIILPLCLVISQGIIVI